MNGQRLLALVRAVFFAIGIFIVASTVIAMAAVGPLFFVPALFSMFGAMIMFVSGYKADQYINTDR